MTIPEHLLLETTSSGRRKGPIGSDGMMWGMGVLATGPWRPVFNLAVDRFISVDSAQSQEVSTCGTGFFLKLHQELRSGSQWYHSSVSMGGRYMYDVLQGHPHKACNRVFTEQY